MTIDDRGPPTNDNASPRCNGVEAQNQKISDHESGIARDGAQKESAAASPGLITITIFPDRFAKSANEYTLTWENLCSKLRATTGVPTKEGMRLLKLARFGTQRTDKGSLRSDANVIFISGIEGDYDAEKVSMAAAHKLLRAADIRAFLYTTPSHTRDKPRWRVLAPLSQEYPPPERSRFLAMLNGVLGGMLANESFTLSQSYYFGRVKGAVYETAHSEGQYIDLLDLPRQIKPAPTAKKAATGTAKASAPIGLDPLDVPSPEQMAELKCALECIPSDDRALWVDIAMALKTIANDGGWELFSEWSRKSSKYDDADAERVWASLQPKATHWRRVFVVAGHHGWANPLSKVVTDAPDGELPADAIWRLAKFPQLDYELARINEAARLGMRVTVLDEMVARKRPVPAGAPDDFSGQALTFPEVDPWHEPVSGAEILDEIASLCRRFLFLPPHSDVVICLWILLTHVAESFYCLPILLVRAPTRGCGKSTVLDLVMRLCCKALPASNITTAALFRVVEEAHPTLLLDEADSFLKTNDEMRGIIDSGHTRTSAYVLRVVGEDMVTRKFSTWGPKAIAGIGRMPGTIEDRSLVVPMQRLGPKQHVEKLRRKQFPDLQRKLARWAADHASALSTAEPEMPEELHNRAADNWEPLYAIANAAGGAWPERVQKAALALTNAAVVALPDVGEDLLRAIQQAFASSGRQRMRTVELLAALCAEDSGRWKEFEHGRPINATRLAELLDPYGIGPNTLRPEGGGAWVTSDGEKQTAKAYDLGQFKDAFVRYISPFPGKGGESAVTPSQLNKDVPFSGFSMPSQSVSDTTPQLPLSPNNDGLVTTVTAENRLSGGSEFIGGPEHPQFPKPWDDPSEGAHAPDL